jgi:hypothetical protein
MMSDWRCIPLYVAQHHVTDVEVRYGLAWSTKKGWHPHLCYIAGDADDLVGLSFRQADVGTFARVITDAAEREWQIHGEAILDDLGLLESEPYEAPEYTDRAYIPVTHNLRTA